MGGQFPGIMCVLLMTLRRLVFCSAVLVALLSSTNCLLVRIPSSICSLRSPFNQIDQTRQQHQRDHQSDIQLGYPNSFIRGSSSTLRSSPINNDINNDTTDDDDFYEIDFRYGTRTKLAFEGKRDQFVSQGEEGEVRKGVSRAIHESNSWQLYWSFVQIRPNEHPLRYARRIRQPTNPDP